MTDRHPRRPMPRVTTFALLVLGCLLFACAGESPAPRETAELVLRGGRIVTLDPQGAEVEALAARGGRLVAVGSRQQIDALIGPSTRVIELAPGQLAIPGLIEGHGHFLGIGDAKIQLDLRSADSWAAVIDQVRLAAAEVDDGVWIRGRGWHQDKWRAAPEQTVAGFPLHDALSAVSPENPVLLTHASGHALLANARAMALAGITADTPDPPGGAIMHDSGGRPTGLFNEGAQDLIHIARSSDSAATSAEDQRRIELASAECLRKGITSFHDAGTPFAALGALRRAAADQALGVRLWVMIRDSVANLEQHLAAAKTSGEYLTIGGIKLSIDGALGSRGAWLLEPYSDRPDTSGHNLVSLQDARRTAELAWQHGYQLGIHAIGDRGNREVLDMYEDFFADQTETADHRWRIEHAQHLHPEDIPRFAALGVTAAFQGIHCTSDGPWVPRRIGDQRAAQGAYMWRALWDSGALLINGTDAPVEDVDPLASFRATVSRRMNNGEVFFGAQVLSREEALATYTKNAARAVFEEADKGTLEVGKLADITVLSQDLLSVPEEQLADTQVLFTIVGGKMAYSQE